MTASIRRLLLSVLPLIAPAALANTPTLIPMPTRLEACTGETTLDARSAITASGSGARDAEIASLLSEAIAMQTGLDLAVTATRDTASPGIELRRDPRIHGDEAYRLEIGPRGVVIAAAGSRGLLWGVQTLRQLLPPRKGALVVLPCLRIEDAPALAYRGQMLDVSRHFFPVDFIKRQLDVLSYYKINTFRWHLTDDQGWRIQIRKYPKLTDVGAWRSEPDGTRHGGFYTQDEVRDVVDYARRRGIMVIPEIEMPGHASAALVAYPELACASPPTAVPAVWGVHKDIFCAGKEEVFGFLEDVLDEVMELFPAPYVHIGGDEVPKDRWRACMPCQALMRHEGLKDEGELQSWFVRRIQQYLRGKGRTMIGWDEILEGGMARDAVIEVWRGADEGHKALANGNRIVNATAYYLDQLPDRLSLEQVYAADPYDGADAVRRVQVWGAEAPLWTERVTTRNAEAMLYPRMLAFADSTWNAGRPRDFAGFRRRLDAHYHWLDAQGIAYGPEDRPLARYEVSFDRQRRHWTLRANHGLTGMRSHYVLDGRAPTATDLGFDTQIAIDRSGQLRIAPFRGARQALEPIGFRLVSHMARGADVRVVTPASPKYANASVLTDGVAGGERFADGTWAGWEGSDLDATLDLGERTRFERIAIDFLQAANDWIVLPRDVTMSVSEDGRSWRELDRRELQPDPLQSGSHVETVEFRAAKPLHARWLRVRASNYGALPAAHAGAGGKAWIFASEIRVE